MSTINPADSSNGGWIKLSNKYSSKCKVCLEEIDVGEIVLWKRGDGIKHQNCKPVLVEEIKPLTEKEWIDFKKYNMVELREKVECQCCGKKLSKYEDTYINDERRVCQKHFMV